MKKQEENSIYINNIRLLYRFYTIVMSGNKTRQTPSSFYRRFFAYNAMGYDKFFDPKQMGLTEKGWGVPDHEVMHYVEEHLVDVKTPFFISIITMSSHEPFDSIKHYVSDKRFNGVEPEVTGRYFSSISYTDRVVGQFILNIQKKHPNTFFFVYGDHTPYVINDGQFQRSVLNKKEQMEFVPLFIITPDKHYRYEHEAVASYLDIAPTILHATGVPFSYRSLGINLITNKLLQQPVTYRGHLYNRSELFKEMSETYNNLLSVNCR